MAKAKTKKTVNKKTKNTKGKMPEVEIVAPKKKKVKSDKSNTNKGGKKKTVKKPKKIDALGRDRSSVERKTEKNKLRVLKELEKTWGIVLTAITKLKISNNTFYRWLKDDKEFAKAVEEIQEAYDIRVEDKLKQLIEKDDGHSIRFYLSHRVAKYKPKVGFGQDPDAKPIELIIERYSESKHGKVNQ